MLLYTNAGCCPPHAIAEDSANARRKCVVCAPHQRRRLCCGKTTKCRLARYGEKLTTHAIAEDSANAYRKCEVCAPHCRRRLCCGNTKCSLAKFGGKLTIRAIAESSSNVRRNCGDRSQLRSAIAKHEFTTVQR